MTSDNRTAHLCGTKRLNIPSHPYSITHFDRHSIVFIEQDVPVGQGDGCGVGVVVLLSHDEGGMVGLPKE